MKLSRSLFFTLLSVTIYLIPVQASAITLYCQKVFAVPVTVPPLPVPTIRCNFTWVQSDENPYNRGFMYTWVNYPGSTLWAADFWTFNSPSIPNNSTSQYLDWENSGIYTVFSEANLYFSWFNPEGPGSWENVYHSTPHPKWGWVPIVLP
ncbi:MAG: hypothetical protein GKR91_05495 [Pseudomonadales bacterium]|nr:hypothetical protein [Pseudomonadales bacterium]